MEERSPKIAKIAYIYPTRYQDTLQSQSWEKGREKKE